VLNEKKQRKKSIDFFARKGYIKSTEGKKYIELRLPLSVWITYCGKEEKIKGAMDMDIRSRKILSKAIAALVFSAAVTGTTVGNVAAGAYDGDANTDGLADQEDLGTSVKSILGVASNYNVFLSGSYRQTVHNNVDAGDGNGVLAVGGDYDVGAENSQKCASAAIGGSVTGTVDGTLYQGADTNIDFESAFSELKTTSSALASVATSEGATVENRYGTLTFTGTNTDVNVFNLTAEEWAALKGADAGTRANTEQGLYFNVPDGSTVIVNIVGAGPVDLTFNWGATYSSTGQLTSGNKYGNSKVLFNVPGGNSVVIGSGVGSLLAPESDIVSSNYAALNAHYEGQVIAKSFSGNIEFGSSTFDDADVSPIISTPEETDEEKEEETPEDETTEDETSEGETSEDETPDDETPADETPADETPSDETDYHEVEVPQDTPIDYLVTTSPEVTEIEDETPADETPADETPADETPADETPADETPADETPADETPADETPADETPADETPADETTADETPADETPADETPADETPADETPADETPADETPADETPADETPADETTPLLPPMYVPVNYDPDDSTDDEIELTEIKYEEDEDEDEDDDELVLTEIRYDSDDDEEKPAPKTYDFDENATPLGDFPNFGSSSDNPNTGVASPIAAGAAAVASLAAAIASRKKKNK